MAERVRLITYVAVPDGVPDEDPDGTWLVDGVVEPEELDEPVFVGRELIVGVLLVVTVAVGVFVGRELIVGVLSVTYSARSLSDAFVMASQLYSTRQSSTTTPLH